MPEFLFLLIRDFLYGSKQFLQHILATQKPDSELLEFFCAIYHSFGNFGLRCCHLFENIHMGQN
ncbi:MAG TPA: hypothetical protein DHW15_07615 [Bacteroidetes bacterium]|nr:hypothetical protein [Bacteroidota bacterium]